MLSKYKYTYKKIIPLTQIKEPKTYYFQG